METWTTVTGERTRGRTHATGGILAGMVNIDPTEVGLYNNVHNDAVYRKISYHGLVITRGPGALYHPTLLSNRHFSPAVHLGGVGRRKRLREMSSCTTVWLRSHVPIFLFSSTFSNQLLKAIRPHLFSI